MSRLVQKDNILVICITLLVMINFIIQILGFLNIQEKLISFLKVIVLDYDTLFLFKISYLLVNKESFLIVDLVCSVMSVLGEASFKLVSPLLTHPNLQASSAILLERRFQTPSRLSIVGAYSRPYSLAFWLIYKQVLCVLVEASSIR